MRLRSLFYDLLTLHGIFWHSRPWCGPRIAQVNISDNCNLDCSICNHASMGVSGLLDAGKVTALVDELDRLGTQEIFYHGFGEPGLHPRLPEMIQHTRQHTRHLRQHLITNGTWDSPKLLESIVANQVNVRFSLHAGDAGTWQQVHPHDDLKFFRQAGNNLLQLTGLAADRVEVLYVLCKANYHKIDEMVAYALDHGVRKILFRPMRLFKDRAGQYMNAHLLPSAEEFRESASNVARHRRALEGRVEVHSIPFEQNRYDSAQGRPSSRAFYLTRSCYVGYMLTVIERDGSVWGCLPESSEGKPLGNIHEKSFREIWYGQPYEDFRRNQLFLDKSALDHEGCHSYCQHLDTNLRLNRIRPWRKHTQLQGTGVSE